MDDTAKKELLRRMNEKAVARGYASRIMSVFDLRALLSLYYETAGERDEARFWQYHKNTGILGDCETCNKTDRIHTLNPRHTWKSEQWTANAKREMEE